MFLKKTQFLKLKMFSLSLNQVKMALLTLYMLTTKLLVRSVGYTFQLI